MPLEIDSLRYEADGERLIDDLSLGFNVPGISVIMGANGAGKSLFLRLIHGLLPTTSGSIRWNGETLDLSTRRRQALVFQKPVLMRRSVAANLDFVLKPRGGDYRHKRELWLREAGLLRQQQQPARLLSGGEQQKLALVRALATEPEVLLLDEPCASIDSASTLQIENLLKQSHERGVKIILVTHDIGQARRLADDVVFIHHGQQLEHQPASAFFDSPASDEARAYLDGRIIV